MTIARKPLSTKTHRLIGTTWLHRPRERPPRQGVAPADTVLGAARPARGGEEMLRAFPIPLSSIRCVHVGFRDVYWDAKWLRARAIFVYYEGAIFPRSPPLVKEIAVPKTATLCNFIPLTLDASSGVPLYRQVYEAVRRAILGGQFGAR